MSTSNAPQRVHRAELERSLGLPAAMAIGLGTMVGAGIFVFPGLAGGQAGPAAALSFAIGAGVALLVALAAAELGTAMPTSGGPLEHVSRTLGPGPGTVVGVAQWAGLVFAAAFYLVGFGHYATRLAERLDLEMLTPALLAAVLGLLLTAINVLGTRGAGRLQNIIVALLLVLLVSVIGRGLYGLAMPGGPVTVPDDWTPRGLSPVLPTAALVFTAYLGFVQIAAVAGEVRRPARTLPRAILGSVLIVGTLYVLTMIVVGGTLDADRLEALGETAMITVAEEIWGGAGGTIMLAAGLLATLSSANASILSSSRTTFALSRAGRLPPPIARVSARFGTPHLAILCAGLPIALLGASGAVERLAEVASVLHLVIYGLLCAAQWTMRRRDRPGGGAPFRAPGVPWAPAAGAALSLGLIAYMDLAATGIASAILIAAALWYRFGPRWGQGENADAPSP